MDGTSNNSQIRCNQIRKKTCKRKILIGKKKYKEVVDGRSYS